MTCVKLYKLCLHVSKSIINTNTYRGVCLALGGWNTIWVVRAWLKAQYVGQLMKGKTEIWHSLLFLGIYLAEKNNSPLYIAIYLV